MKDEKGRFVIEGFSTYDPKKLSEFFNNMKGEVPDEDIPTEFSLPDGSVWKHEHNKDPVLIREAPVKEPKEAKKKLTIREIEAIQYLPDLVAMAKELGVEDEKLLKSKTKIRKKILELQG